MSFRDEVLEALTKVHTPVSTNDLYKFMCWENLTLMKMGVANGKEKLSQTLSDLRRKKNLIESKHNDSGVLVWDWKVEAPVTPIEIEIAPVPAIPVPVHKKSERAIVKDLLIDFAEALRKAADAL